MTDHLVLHPQTKLHVRRFLDNPSHALLLVGHHGIGKTHLAEAIIAHALQTDLQTLSQHPYVTRLQAEKDSISIDVIRELQQFLSLKTLGNQPLRRAVIIEHAERLTLEAQNAYLKLLEEPPADTIMILTVDNQRVLLPTICSRLQTIMVNVPSAEEVSQHFVAQGRETAAVQRTLLLSGGLPGLMQAFLGDDTTHPMLAAVNTAKTLLQQSLFDRLVLAESLSKQKTGATYVVEALQHIAQTGLEQAAVKGNAAKIKQWHHILGLASDARAALTQSANAKLVLSNLVLCM